MYSIVCLFLVEASINDYLFNLPFDGELRITNLIDQIQLVTGVIDATNVQAEAKYAAFNYTPFQVAYSSFAGYLEIDSAFPLSSTITYTPKF